MNHSERPHSDWEEEISCLLEDPRKTAPRLNLSSKCAITNYLRFADEVKFWIESGRILDWGCGSGQMSWLLDRRMLEVVSYDLEDKRLEKLVQPHIPFQLALDGYDLPFSDASFDGVLSCGVLEHVPNERISLAEIHRILKPGGYLFVYQLPQVYAYTEFINRMRGLWYHPRRYTLRSATTLLRETGFAVLTHRRSNLFPKNLTGSPAWMRNAYNSISRYVVAAESMLVEVPVLNWLCHSLEFVARKR
jgi:SAM-dependent methyltransferase